MLRPSVCPTPVVVQQSCHANGSAKMSPPGRGVLCGERPGRIVSRGDRARDVGHAAALVATVVALPALGPLASWAEDPAIGPGGFSVAGGTLSPRGVG